MGTVDPDFVISVVVAAVVCGISRRSNAGILADFACALIGATVGTYMVSVLELVTVIPWRIVRVIVEIAAAGFFAGVASTLLCRLTRTEKEKAAEEEIRREFGAYRACGTVISIRAVVSGREVRTEVETTEGVFLVRGEIEYARKGAQVWFNGYRQMRIDNSGGRTYRLASADA